MANEYRAVTVAAEVLRGGTSSALLAQTGVEVLRSTASGPTFAVVGLTGVEVLRSIAVGNGRRRAMIVG